MDQTKKAYKEQSIAPGIRERTIQKENLYNQDNLESTNTLQHIDLQIEQDKELNYDEMKIKII